MRRKSVQSTLSQEEVSRRQDKTPSAGKQGGKPIKTVVVLLCMLASVGYGISAHAASNQGGGVPCLPVLLLVGVITNGCILIQTFQLQDVKPSILYPTQVFAAVNGYRCVFPCRYAGNVVLHDTWLSSIFLTRVLATFSELSWIYQLSQVAQDLNRSASGRHHHRGWVNGAAWIMFGIDLVAQCFVWSALLMQTDKLMFYEEACWAGMFIINTIMNYALKPSSADTSLGGCSTISLWFGAFYLPWQVGLHLPKILRAPNTSAPLDVSLRQIQRGGMRALTVRNPTVDAAKWGGHVGAVWMIGYWIALPFWLLVVAKKYSKSRSP